MSVLYLRIAICPRKCENGGSCVAPHTCSCLPGFTGDNCQTGKVVDMHFTFNFYCIPTDFLCSSIWSYGTFLLQTFVPFPANMEENAREVLVFACLDGLAFLVTNVSRNKMKTLTFIVISVSDYYRMLFLTLNIVLF